MDTEQKIQQQLAGHTVMLYIKGTPDFPQCGYSAKVVNILTSLGAQFAFVNILENPDIRATLPKYSNWPTFPQLYINADLIGGCDIVSELQQTGELQTMLATVKALDTTASFVNAA